MRFKWLLPCEGRECVIEVSIDDRSKTIIVQ